MSRRRELQAERDDLGRPLYTRVTTNILAENYNAATRHGLQFGALLDRAIRERRNELDVPTDPLMRWVADRTRRGELTSPEQLAAKKAELVAKGHYSGAPA